MSADLTLLPEKITPEMLAAGAEAMALFDRGDEWEPMLEAVFLAMVAASPTHSTS